MSAYYNEFDTKAAAWLRGLIDAGETPEGTVDERDIRQVRADDLLGYRRCHFFAGVAGWELALRLAGWPDDEPVWTGSCPCPPFSSAGKKNCPVCGQRFRFYGEDGFGCEKCNTKDQRHLWPEFRRLIALCRPPVVFGEQAGCKATR